MTGAIHSVIGMRVNEVLYHFTTKLPSRFEVASGRAWLCAVLIEADAETGKALSIQRLIKESDGGKE
jgi:calcineurin-like phosphoesterase